MAKGRHFQGPGGPDRLMRGVMQCSSENSQMRKVLGKPGILNEREVV